MSVSETYVKRFNRAAALAREGDAGAALRAYDRIFDPLPARERHEASGDFVATIELRRAFCLMDLGRYDEALRVLEGARLFELLHALDAEGRFEHLFALGNVLGELGRLRDAEDVLERAQAIAVELVNDELFDRAVAWQRAWRDLREALAASR